MSNNKHLDDFPDDDLPVAKSNDDIMEVIAKGTWEMVKSMKRLADAVEQQNKMLYQIIQSHDRADEELSNIFSSVKRFGRRMHVASDDGSLPPEFLKTALVRDRANLKDIEL